MESILKNRLTRISYKELDLVWDEINFVQLVQQFHILPSCFIKLSTENLSLAATFREPCVNQCLLNILYWPHCYKCSHSCLLRCSFGFCVSGAPWTVWARIQRVNEASITCHVETETCTFYSARLDKYLKFIKWI